MNFHQFKHEYSNCYETLFLLMNNKAILKQLGNEHRFPMWPQHKAGINVETTKFLASISLSRHAISKPPCIRLGDIKELLVILKLLIAMC